MIPLHELLVQNVRSLLLILLGAVGFVLLIACGNVANLLLSRGVLRAKEMAVRAALGARRVRLIRQLLTEGLLLAAAGGALGLLAGLWGTRLLEQLIPSSLPSGIHMDLRVLAFSAGVAMLAVLVFGLVPALMASRADAGEALKEGGSRAGASPAAHRLRSLMSAGEIALSLILLVGAGLLMRSFMRLTEVELGFDPHGLLIATVQRPRPLTASFDSREYSAFFQNALERVRNLPGVKDAAVTSQYPLGPPHNGTTLLNVRGAGQVRLPQVAMVTSISPDYFRAMRIQLLKGRVFGEEDAAGAQPVVIVNAALARILFRDTDAVGQHISFYDSPTKWTKVVGVVSATRDGTLEQEPGPEIFVPYLQQPSFSMAFVLRTKSHPNMLSGAVRNAVQRIDKNQPLFDVTPMDEVIASSIAPRRFKMLLLGVFALLALALAAVGIYGVITYSCGQRAHEFGIRMALGAERRDILKLAAGQAFKVTLAGVSIGVVGALGLTRFMASLLYDVKPADPATFVGVSLVLTVVALLASYIPARRATKIDPMAALREE